MKPSSTGGAPSEAGRLRRRKLLLWMWVLGVTAALVGLVVAVGEPPPPQRVVLATGVAGGGYDQFGRDLARLVGEGQGPRVAVRRTAGSVDNLRLLAERRVDVAFVQGGIASALRRELPTHRLRAIARVYSEPLWVFYRADQEVRQLAQLRGTRPEERRRIAIGPEGSGTQPIALELLRVNGVHAGNAVLLRLPLEQAAEALARGDLEVLFMVASPQAETVQRLLRDDRVRLMNFVRHQAYARRLPYLTAIHLEQGLLSLQDAVPPEDVVLLAPSATLVTRDDVHPRIVELFAKAASRRFGAGNLLDLAGEFPSGTRLELPQHEAARRFLAEGESWLSRTLPFWAMRLVTRLVPPLIPLLTILLPALKLVPLLAGLHVRKVLKRHYETLRDIETRLRGAARAEQVRAELDALDALRRDLAALSAATSGAHQEALYHCRAHVALVRGEALERLASWPLRDTAEVRSPAA